MPASNQSKFTTLAEWAAAREDMRIVCACGRTINLPAGKIVERSKFDSEILLALTRLRYGSCGRCGHATVVPVSFLNP